MRHGAPPVEVDVRTDGTLATVTVTDHGAGVAEGDRERVFTPFFRSRKTNVGAGLGLTLVRQIALQHGGDVAWAGTSERPSSIRATIPAVLRAR
jgi:signal transduction histidine kinase